MYWDLASEEDRQLHLSRYRFARDHFQSAWKCLDAACGSGYGSAFIAEKVASVSGLDVDPSAIEYAIKRYGGMNLSFACADLQRELPFPDATFDGITSFETIEHLEKQREMIGEFHRVLKPGGILVMSSPDRNMSQKLGLDNRFHVAERTKREFVELLSERFTVERLFGQGQGNPVASHWKSTHNLLRAGAHSIAPGLRSRIERALARPFRWIRGHFYDMSSTPIRPIESLDTIDCVYVIAVAKKHA